MNDWSNLRRAVDDFTRYTCYLYKKQLIEQGKEEFAYKIKVLDGEDGTIELPDYWKYVEHGRRPGKFPPPDAILSWIERKQILPRPVNGITPSLDSLAYLIGRKIATEGIPPGNQLDNAMEEAWEKYEAIINEAIEKDIQEKISQYIENLSSKVEIFV